MEGGRHAKDPVVAVAGGEETGEVGGGYFHGDEADATIWTEGFGGLKGGIVICGL